MKIKNKTFGASLLVAGTAIGAGMLALPITTGIGGLLGGNATFGGLFCIYVL